MASIPMNIVFQTHIFKQIVNCLLEHQNVKIRSSLDKIIIIRNLSEVCKTFEELVKKNFPECYNLTFFFKGFIPGLSYWKNFMYFKHKIHTVSFMEKFWVIKDFNIKSFNLCSYTESIRFSHVCNENEYRHLKDFIFLKEFPDKKFPLLTEAVNLEILKSPETKTRIKRIRKGKIRKLSFFNENQVINEV